MENWQRLQKVVRWTGMSVNAFAHHIGLKRSENLYQIKKGNHGISKQLALIITTAYPEINRSWLLTGEGDMLKDGDPDSKRGIPFYNADIASVIGSQQPSCKPLYYIDVPIFHDCDFAALSTSTAMTPEIPAGAVVVLKRQEPAKILPGEPYLVVAADFLGIRILRTFPGDQNKIRLVPRNTADYDEMAVDLSDVQALYLVKGVIIAKAL